MGVKAQGLLATDQQKDEEQIKQNDGYLNPVAEEPQSPVEVTFSPTNSVIDANTFEYSPVDGERLKRILDTPREKLAAAIGDFRPKATVNGNYMAEVCASRDGAFLAVQLHQFTRMSYEPVTDVLLFEGDDARAVKRLF